MLSDQTRVLLQAWMTRTASQEQQDELFGQLRDDVSGEDLRDWLREAYAGFEPTGPVLPPERSKALLDRILEVVQASEDTPVHDMPVRRPWWRYAAAAAIILVLMTAGYRIFLYRMRQAPTTEVRVHNLQADVPPGGNKAVLILAGGSRIILDSAANGLLAQQGGTRIEKIATGQLAYRQQTAGPVQYNTLTTPKGGQYQVTLPDGTRVWLNAASSITYPTVFDGPERAVSLSGEAYFEVAHQQGKAFTVHAGGAVLRDLGTAFNVNAYTDEPSLRTTLAEGALQVDDLVLSPGQQAERQPDGRMRLIAHADVEQALAWKDGLFRFGHTDLATILRQLARWYDIDIDDRSGAGSAIHLSGVISRNIPLSGVLQLLESNGVRCTIKEKTLIVE